MFFTCTFTSSTSICPTTFQPPLRKQLDQKSSPTQPKLTMTLPLLASLSVPSAQHPAKKLLQISLDGIVSSTSPVPGYIQVQSHKCKAPANESKTIISKKKTGPKYAAFPKVPNAGKKSVQLAHYVHIQDILKNIFNSFQSSITNMHPC
jgi:hypothetical protein